MTSPLPLDPSECSSSGSPRLVRILPEHLREHPSLCAMFEDALRPSLENAADEDVRAVIAGCLEGRMQLWAASCLERGLLGAAVTAINLTSSGRKYCVILYLAGRRAWPAMRGLLGELEDWARAEGCQRLELFGRPGWRRALEPFGYAQVPAIVMRKDL